MIYYVKLMSNILKSLNLKKRENMEETRLPLELLSNFFSILILIAIFVKYYQYKKKLDVLKGLDELKSLKQLTQEDKDFIQSNFKDYRYALDRDEKRLKTFYPAFILVAGVLIAFFSFQEALIHLNVVVVAYIYLHVGRIHNRNFVSFLQELTKDLD